ncbi:MAG: ribbon-helix-helix protein, CopG family, partial [Candidatus Competibacteraceae bacterium]
MMVCLRVLNSRAGIDRYSFQHYYSDIHRYPRETLMRTVQITLEEDLVQAVDRAADRLDQSRSAFTRAALRAALARLAVQAREQQHRAGYLRQPVT